MRTLKLGLLVLLSLGTFQIVNGQFGNKSGAIQEIQKRDLIVIVNKLNAKIQKKLEKKGESDILSACQSMVDKYNQDMKEVMEKFWKFSNGSIIYKTNEEYDELMKDKSNKSKYAVIYCCSSEQDGGFDFDWQVDTKDNSMSGTVVKMFAYLPDDKGGDITNYMVTLGELVPSKASLICAIERLKTWYAALLDNKMLKPNIASDKMIKDNQHKLADKTLLIRKKDIQSDVTPSQIKAYYPFPYKIVDEEEMDKYITSKDSNYAFVGCIISGTGSAVQFYVMDCLDGSYLAESGSGSSLQGGWSNKANPKSLSAANLKEFCQYIESADSKKKNK